MSNKKTKKSELKTKEDWHYAEMCVKNGYFIDFYFLHL